MYNILNMPILRWSSAGSLVSGVSVLATTASHVLTGQVLRQGGTLFDGHVFANEAALHGAAPMAYQSDVRTQLIIGMLLILLGFALHALWIVRMKKVRVHARRRR